MPGLIRTQSIITVDGLKPGVLILPSGFGLSISGGAVAISINNSGVTGPGPNEPAGYVAQFDNPMSTGLVNSPSVDQYGFFGYNDGTHSEVSVGSDASAPATPPAIYHHIFPANQPGGSAFFRYQAGNNFSANNGNLYVRQRFLASSNYTHGSNTGTKFWFPRPGLAGSGEGSINHFFGFTDQNSTPPRSKLNLFFGTQFAGGGAGTNSWESSFDLPKGVWHDIEYLLLANTPGVANGIVKQWVDGVLAYTITNAMLFQSGMTPHWGYTWVEPTYGFGSNSTPAFDMWWDIDQWYVSVK